MKNIIYYLVLLIFIALLTGFLVQPHPNGMSMAQMFSVSALLALYVVAMSFVGEGKAFDEREVSHRYSANRSGLVAGTVVLSIGVLYQLFTHKTDYWLLAGLIAINLVKIVSLIYSNHKN
jgi:high-affinity Fe2+/Pb2+ permease